MRNKAISYYLSIHYILKSKVTFSTIKIVLGKVAGLISLLAFIPYFISIFKGKTKPNRITWWIWTLLGLLLYFSYKEAGAKETLWVPLIYIIAPLITAILSIKYGVGGWTHFDIFCLIGSLLSTLLWAISGSPIIALILFLIIDLFGALPTIKKAYSNPEQENKLAWFLMCLANVVNLFATENVKFSVLIYPLYMLLIGSIIFGLLIRKPIIAK